MARTRDELWSCDSVWKDTVISTIIPPKKPTPKKSLHPSPTVLKTNYFSNSLPFNTSQKFLPELPITSSKFSTSYSKHSSPLRHLSKHRNKKHFPKSRHHHPKHVNGREFEKTAVEVLASLHMSQERLSQSQSKSPNKSLNQRQTVKASKTSHSLELPDGDKRKNMIPKVILRDIGHIIRKACPKLNVSTNVSKNTDDILCRSPGSGLPELVDLGGGKFCMNSLDPPVYEVDEEDAESLSESSQTSKSARSTIVRSPLPTISPSKISNNISSNFKNSEKSSVLNVPSFDILGAKAPSFAKPAVSLVPAVPAVSVSFATTASQPISPAVPAVSVSFSTTASQPISPAFQPFSFRSIPKSASTSPPLTERPLCERTSIPREQPDSPKSQSSSNSVKPQANKTICHIKDGFLGFPEEDGRRLRKTRFHVNTNILASSLDLLDLHKNVGVSTGSPYCCSSCAIVFSSVKHCKYHQSVISSDVVDTQVTDVQEDGFWLCPWCPTIALSSNYFESHKETCREKGRCHQESKASSLRKNASTASRRRSCKPSSTTSNLNQSPMKSANSFKVLHGHVIPV